MMELSFRDFVNRGVLELLPKYLGPYVRERMLDEYGQAPRQFEGRRGTVPIGWPEEIDYRDVSALFQAISGRNQRGEYYLFIPALLAARLKSLREARNSFSHGADFDLYQTLRVLCEIIDLFELIESPDGYREAKSLLDRFLDQVGAQEGQTEPTGEVPVVRVEAPKETRTGRRRHGYSREEDRAETASIVEPPEEHTEADTSEAPASSQQSPKDDDGQAKDDDAQEISADVTIQETARLIDPEVIRVSEAIAPSPSMNEPAPARQASAFERLRRALEEVSNGEEDVEPTGEPQHSDGPKQSECGSRTTRAATDALKAEKRADNQTTTGKSLFRERHKIPLRQPTKGTASFPAGFAGQDARPATLGVVEYHKIEASQPVPAPKNRSDANALGKREVNGGRSAIDAAVQQILDLPGCTPFLPARVEKTHWRSDFEALASDEAGRIEFGAWARTLIRAEAPMSVNRLLQLIKKRYRIPLDDDKVDDSIVRTLRLSGVKLGKRRYIDSGLAEGRFRSNSLDYMALDDIHPGELKNIFRAIRDELNCRNYDEGTAIAARVLASNKVDYEQRVKLRKLAEGYIRL